AFTMALRRRYITTSRTGSLRAIDSTAGWISASDPAWRESRPGKAFPAGADVLRADVLAQAVARRVRHPAGTGNIPLNLRSFVDSEARSAERTTAGRGGCRTRAGGRYCVCGDDGPGDGAASGRTAGSRQTH